MVNSRSLLNMRRGLPDLSFFGPIWGRLQLFHRAKQWVLMDTRVFVHLRYLTFCDFAAEHATNALAAGVDVEHHLGRALAGHVEKRLEHRHHEFHRGVVIVEQHDLVERRSCGFRATGLYDGALLAFGLVLVGFFGSHGNRSAWPEYMPAPAAGNGGTAHQMMAK